MNKAVSTLIISILFIAMGCAAQKAHVENGDPTKSFFRDQVTYPYRVKYADVRSDDGSEWEIGYMDVSPIFRSNPKTLVLIHGRACNGAYFGHAIKTAVDSGIRVIVPDLPHCGKSIPGNLDRSPVRTLQQTREAVHDLVVNHLKIPKAYYGGHSMGGLFALGYALTYPEAVDGLVLIAPAGLEELPAKHFPPHLAQSTNRADFDPIPYYTRKARLDYSTNASLIENFYFYRLKVKGKLVPSGFFKTETPDTRLFTRIRTQMIAGNPREFERYSLTSLRDTYALGCEIIREDPDSLFKQYERIQAPILLIFGDEEPFYPKKITGLKDLKKDMIAPFYRRMTAAGNKVLVKLYPGCGHFPHNDLPDLFGRDLVQFVSKGSITAPAAPDTF